MVNLIKLVTENSLFKFLIMANGYFFLIIVFQQTIGRSSFVAQISLLISICMLVGWTTVICIKKGAAAGSEILYSRVKSLKNATIYIAYWALIAVVLGDDYHNIWLVYGLIAMQVVLVLAAITFKKKG